MTMMIKPFSYQRTAVDQCIQTLKQKDTFKLQAPTGSGKTFITSLIINDYIFDNDLNFNKNTTFIFIAPSTGQLEKQGQEKIQNYLDKGIVSGFRTQYIGVSKNKKSNLLNIKCFEPNVVYFIGWQMFKKGTNITNLDSERNNIFSVINNTKLNDTNIVLIIDEAHREKQTKKSTSETKQTILEYLNPHKQIELSATLNEAPDYRISYNDVRAECAIKQNVTISGLNDKVENLNQMESEKQLILSAIKKQKEVKEEYFKNNIKNINPLILIQIPDNIKIDEISTEKQLINKIENILKKENINYAIWLDKNKTTKNKIDIVKNDSLYDVLIFKTAIATGWDIPRANILVKIRDVKSNNFNIQTLGRILRNPHLEYFNIPNIDNAFVYTKDVDYINDIKQESIVIYNDDFEIVERSKKSTNTNFSIDIIQVKMDKKLDEQPLIKYVVDQIMNNDVFISRFLKIKEEIEFTKKYTTDFIEVFSNSNKTTSELNNLTSINSQMQLNFNKPKQTLLSLYMQYRTITNSSLIINKILEQISRELSDKKNIKIKNFYKACIQNWNEFYEFENNIETKLIIYIKKLIDTYSKEYIKYETKPFFLPKEYLINKSKFNYGWDEVNTFDFALNVDNLDSKQEKQFYISIKNEFDRNDNIHVFRNGTSPDKDYYIEYIDRENKIRKFFPDFIIINEDKRIYSIIECKDISDWNNIDINSKEKFRSFKSYYDNNMIKSNYTFAKLYRVSLDKNQRLVGKDEINLDSETVKFTEILRLIK